MKKILMVLILLSIVSYAYEYEYLVFKDGSSEGFYIGDDGVLYYQYQNTLRSPMGGYSWGTMVFIAGVRNGGNKYVSRSTFIGYLKNDLRFLNDMFIQAPQLLLNFYFNRDGNHFSNSDHFVYEYDLLYDVNGYAVEAIVGDVWVGKYDDSEKNISGDLYDNSGNLVYRNGEKYVSFFDEILARLDFLKIFVSANFWMDILWFVVAVLAFSVLFWVLHHVVDGLRYGYDLYKNRR